jgi:glycerol uptake facilitator-like aquaporin
MSKRLTAEFIGTLWLVLGGCGSAVLAAAFPSLGIGFVGAALVGVVYRWVGGDEPGPTPVTGNR